MKKNKPAVIFTMCVMLIFIYSTPIFAIQANQDKLDLNTENALHEIDPNAEDIFDQDNPAAMKPESPIKIVDDEKKQQQLPVEEEPKQAEMENTATEKKPTSTPRAAGAYTFTITIPDEIRLGETNTVVQITATGVLLEPTAYIIVKMDPTVVLKNGSSELVAVVQNGILEFSDNATKEVEITKPTGLLPIPGTYKAVMTVMVDYVQPIP